jgi:hypothetical protein
MVSHEPDEVVLPKEAKRDPALRTRLGDSAGTVLDSWTEGIEHRGRS